MYFSIELFVSKDSQTHFPSSRTQNFAVSFPNVVSESVGDHTIPLRFKIIEKDEKISSCLEESSGISSGVLARLILGISVRKRGIPFLKQN